MAQYNDATWRESMRLRFDLNNMMAEAVGEAGFSEAEINALAERIYQADRALKSRRAAGDLAWMELPYQTTSADEILSYVEGVRGKFENFVVLGIGGSALGNIALHSALNHLYYNLLPPQARHGNPRLFVLDNVDPEFVAGLLDVIEAERTLFNVISKSGETAETMAQFLIFRDMLMEKLGQGYIEHIVATTDKAKGYLRPIAEAEGYVTFPIPDGVGGRFSVLSAVGLLSAAICGIDIRELLAGAAYADEVCRETDLWHNPAYMNAALQFLGYTQGLNILVMMPYVQALWSVADWFRQIWAESLGKRVNRSGQEVHIGPTPVKALGTTDQHSQVQLYIEGPHNKIINFLAVEQYHRDLPIPAAFTDQKGVAYLGGHTLGELIWAEWQATALALTAAGRPNCTHILPELNAFTLGQLLYTLEVQTAISGELYDINAFNQPGVEAGKIATYALLGRKGYQERRAEIEASLRRRNPRFII